MNRRIALHAVLMSPLWAAFAMGWWRVLRNWPIADLARSFALLAVIAALYSVTLALWIRHNLKIYERKGPRRAVRAVTADFSRDVIGTVVRCAEPGAFDAQHVTIELSGNEKVYRSSDGSREFQYPKSHADHIAVH